MDGKKILEWLYSDIDDLIDFNGYGNELEGDIENEYNREGFTAIGDDSGKPGEYNAW